MQPHVLFSEPQMEEILNQFAPKACIFSYHGVGVGVGK